MRTDMTAYVFAHFARLLPEQWQQDRFSRLAFANRTVDAESLYRRVARAR
jgi:hypothetical protein